MDSAPTPSTSSRPLPAALLDLVFAPICLGCDGPVPYRPDAERRVCGRCLSRLRPPPPPLCRRCGAPLGQDLEAGALACAECASWPPVLRCARSAALLHPPADRLVHQLKYRGWHALGETLGRRMATVPLPEDVKHEARAIAPVPTTPSRLRERGYNQAAALAKGLAPVLRIPYRELLVRRAGKGSQTTLQPLARAANVAGAFAVQPAATDAVEGAHILLVDDVLTTGATARECARALEAAGVRCVSIVTFARALDARRILGF